jgi:hypothetical protein
MLETEIFLVFRKLSPTSIVPLNCPGAVSLAVTVIVQLCLGARTSPSQPEVKIPAPEMVTLNGPDVAVPTFETVTVIGAEVPGSTAPKSMDCGFTVSWTHGAGESGTSASGEPGGPESGPVPEVPPQPAKTNAAGKTAINSNRFL